MRHRATPRHATHIGLDTSPKQLGRLFRFVSNSARLGSLKAKRLAMDGVAGDRLVAQMTGGFGIMPLSFIQRPAKEGSSARQVRRKAGRSATLGLRFFTTSVLPWLDGRTLWAGYGATCVSAQQATLHAWARGRTGCMGWPACRCCEPDGQTRQEHHDGPSAVAPRPLDVPRRLHSHLHSQVDPLRILTGPADGSDLTSLRMARAELSRMRALTFLGAGGAACGWVLVRRREGRSFLWNPRSPQNPRRVHALAFPLCPAIDDQHGAQIFRVARFFGRRFPGDSSDMELPPPPRFLGHQPPQFLCPLEESRAVTRRPRRRRVYSAPTSHDEP